MARKSKIDVELDELLRNEQQFADAMSMEEFVKMAMPRYNTLIALGDGVMIDIAGIVRIDKERRFVPSVLGNSRFEWGITINKNVASKDVPNNDVTIWYDREDGRDHEYEQLRTALRNHGRTIVAKEDDDRTVTVSD